MINNTGDQTEHNTEWKKKKAAGYREEGGIKEQGLGAGKRDIEKGKKPVSDELQDG